MTSSPSAVRSWRLEPSPHLPSGEACAIVRRMITGACLCGAVRYEMEGPLHSLLHCHCSMCRKHHGAPFASFVGTAAAGFRWVSGAEGVCEYPSSPDGVRRFCGVCGSVAPMPAGELVFVPLGNLAGDVVVEGGLHAFVGSKAPWHVIADALPKYEAAPPGWPAPRLADPPAIPELPAGETHGSCLCGEVSFSVRGAPSRWYQCHCSRCRRARSAMHGSNTFYPLDQFTWRTGREKVKVYKVPEAARFASGFCPRCGGATPVQRENVPFVLVPASLFDGDPGARPAAHIHVASKAPWHTIGDDGLPQFPELPPA